MPHVEGGTNPLKNSIVVPDVESNLVNDKIVKMHNSIQYNWLPS